MKKWFRETMPHKLEDLEYILHGDGYSLGEKTSLADIVLFSLLTQFFDDKESSLVSMDNTPKLKSIVQRISTNVNILKWLESRPQTDF